MSRGSTNYLEGSRHPASCVLFVLPLLAAYEGGLLLAHHTPTLDYRNGAETWMRLAIERLGVTATFAAPIVLLGILLLWSFLRRHDRPRDFAGIWFGMVIESGLFALGLYVLSQAFLPVVDRMNVFLEFPDPALHKVISYLGAGIYEETLFRLGLFSLLCWIFLLADFAPFFGMNLAALVSALLFAGAHHVGPAAEAFRGGVFLFRALAGFYFAWLYSVRGFGITVGAHTGYDVLVGILMPNL